jgi:RNA polymerase sigma-70 factor (ECF subfamily)
MSGMDLPALLLRDRPRFVAFVRRQVPDDATAEDIVQAAFARATGASDDLRQAERATAWFYRILRNGIVDYYRRTSARTNMLDRLARDGSAADEPAPRRVCACVLQVLPTLRADYATILRAVEIDGSAVEEAARALGITANNASVRLHRARASLKEKLLAFCVNCCSDETVDACRDCYCHD